MHQTRQRHIIHHQSSPATEFRDDRSACLLVNQRQAGRHPERATAADGTFQPGFAPHQLRQTTGDGETQPGAAKAAGGRTVSLLKGHEQPRLIFGGDADAGILNLTAEQDLVTRTFQRFGAQGDGAVFGKFDGIAEIVE